MTPPTPPPSQPAITQLSTVPALASGLYDRLATVRRMRRAGDFGLGTFENLDGELILIDGRTYRFAADGRVTEPGPDCGVSFYTVTFCADPPRVPVASGADYAVFRRWLDRNLQTTNVPHVVLVTGEFHWVKTRSLPKQDRPYPPLIDVTRHQPLFKFQNLSGHLIGFRVPEFLGTVTVPGYHLHFLDRDRRAGGHVLDFKIAQARVMTACRPEFRLILPENAAAFRGFGAPPLSPAELAEIEG